MGNEPEQNFIVRKKLRFGWVQAGRILRVDQHLQQGTTEIEVKIVKQSKSNYSATHPVLPSV
jgi:hypothetical protein